MKNAQHHILIYLHNMIVKGNLVFPRVAEQLGSTVKEQKSKRKKNVEGQECKLGFK